MSTSSNVSSYWSKEHDVYASALVRVNANIFFSKCLFSFRLSVVLFHVIFSLYLHLRQIVRTAFKYLKAGRR